MTLHPQRQRFDAHQRVMRPLRVHRHAQITQTHGDRVEGKGHGPQSRVKVQSVISRLWRCQRRKLARGRPVKLAAVHNHTAGDRAIACQVFGGRMHHQCRAVFDGAAQVGRGGGVINDQWQAVLVGHAGDGIKV
ncbi:unannotated protein [freshwater metagenome]|uniref:Unannotated protein n=1 Tax=freshwater metagenome TaxID=449393 RepID=A0A6J6YHD9_9ZZZZ